MQQKNVSPSETAPATIGERIEYVIDFYQLNDTQAGQKMGRGQSTIAAAKGKEKRPRVDFIQDFLKGFPDVNSDWLLFGAGPMLKSSQAAGRNNVDIIKQFVTIDQYGKNAGRFVPAEIYASFVEGLQDEHTIEALEPVPNYFLPTLADVYYFEVKGHSMEPTVYPGDIIATTEVKDKVKGIKSGRIYLVISKKEGLERSLKRVVYRQGEKHITCHSDNPDKLPEYETFIVPVNDVLAVYELRGRWTVQHPRPYRTHEELLEAKSAAYKAEADAANAIRKVDKLLNNPFIKKLLGNDPEVDLGS